MTDQIPADQVREIIAAMRAAMRRDTPGYSDWECLSDLSRYVRDLEAMLPAPPLPTLADMTEEERRACRWMQADVANRSVRYVIATPRDGDGETTLIAPDGKIDWRFPEYVTPRPDLPRLEWPDTEKPAPAPALPEGWRLADHETHGRGVVTTPTPNSDGRVCFAIPSGSPLGYNWHLCYPDELTYLDQEADTPDTVPPNTLAVGSEWEDVDALARACRESGRDQIVVIDNSGGAYVWDEKAGWWEGSASPQYSPFTILHAGLEADQ